VPTTAAVDGSTLHWQSEGEGPVVVCTNGIATSTFYWDGLRARLAGRARVITWDLPGHGRSAPARTASATRIPALAQDLRRVLDAAGVQRAALIGFSMGCQVVLESWRHMPERIDALVPVLGAPGRLFDHFLHPAVGPQVIRVLKRVPSPALTATLSLGSRALRAPGVHTVNRWTGQVAADLPAAAMVPFYKHLARIDTRTARWMAAAAAEHDACPHLDGVRVPALVIAGGRDSFTPAALSQDVAARIPGAQLIEIEAATHTGLLGQADTILPAVESFLDTHGLLAPGR
jgi:pimeloyl-ACP methyl ester carboxylesterase